MKLGLKDLLLLAALAGAVALVATGRISIPGVGGKGAQGPGQRDAADQRHAGYNWAAERGISDPDDCVGPSQSFIAGCREYTLSR